MDSHFGSQETIGPYEQTSSDAWSDSLEEIIGWTYINSKINAKQGKEPMKLIPFMARISANARYDYAYVELKSPLITNMR